MTLTFLFTTIGQNKYKKKINNKKYQKRYTYTQMETKLIIA